MNYSYTSGMKTAISIPDHLFERTETAAKKLGVSRSKLIQTALEEFLKARRDEAITEALNKMVTEHPPTEQEKRDDAAWRALAREKLASVEWNE